MVNGHKQTEEKGIKAFNIKLLELGKTRTKKSSPDMFNFNVVLAGYDMITDAGRAKTCRLKFEGPSLQVKLKKIEGLLENMGFNGKHFEFFKQKEEQKNYSRPFKKIMELKGSKAIN